MNNHNSIEQDDKKVWITVKLFGLITFLLFIVVIDKLMHRW